MNDLVQKLEQTKAETSKYFDLSAELLERKSAPDKWNVRYLLHHLADAETVLCDRIKRIISEPKQVLWAFNQNLWAEKLEYSQIPMPISKNIYLLVRDAVIYYARLHYKGSERLEYVHSETGIRTLKDEFEKVIWHNELHLIQIKQAIFGFERID